MKRPYRRLHDWTIVQCLEDSIKCNSRKDWKFRYNRSYRIAIKLGWIEECTKHMIKKGNRLFRGLYAFEHPDKTVYVGLTFDYDKRYSEHMKQHSILIEKQKLGGQVFVKFGIFYHIDDAGQKEQNLIDNYKQNGWTIINKTKAGALGRNIRKWTFEKCLESSKPYNSRAAWKKAHRGAFSMAIKNGWLEECCKHMLPKWGIKKKKIICIETNEVFDSVGDAAEKFKIETSRISRVLVGKRKRTGSYSFKYME